MKQNYTCYAAPNLEYFEIDVEGGFALSMENSSHSGFVGDDYNDDYWNDNEVEL